MNKHEDKKDLVAEETPKKKSKKKDDIQEMETLGSNVSIIEQAREEHKHQALESVADASVIEYFYLESPHIPEKFFPIKIYGIFDRVTIEEAKMGRLKEDIIKILSLTKKFGVYEGLESKQDDDNEVSKNLDKEVFTVSNSIRWFTDKNYDPDYDISYPEFTTQHFSPNRAEGACQHCHGLGEILQVDMDRIIDRAAALPKAIIPWKDSVLGQTILKKLAQKYSMDEDLPWHQLPEWFQKVVIDGDGELLRLGMGGKYVSMNYNGIQDVLTSQYNK